MKKLCMAAIASLFFCYATNRAQAAGDAHEFSLLYDCTRKLRQAGAAYNIDLNGEYLADDFFYILDRRTPELYLFTPYYAGKVDLSLLIKAEVKAQLDKTAQQVKDQSFPFTACCQGSMSYNIAIPYVPDDPSQPKGYFYMTITDSSPGMYDEVYWVREEHKMHIKRHDEPFMKSPHDARSNGIIRFLPGPMQTMPDFTNYKPKQAENGITITSVTGQLDKGVEYHPIASDGMLWDKRAQDNFSADARNILLSYIRYGVHALPPIHKVGQKSDCWGHLGCDYTYSAEWVAREQQLHDEAINSCKAVEEDLHVDIFSPIKSDNPPQIKPHPKLAVILNGVSHFGGNYKVLLKIENDGNVPILRVAMAGATLNGVPAKEMPVAGQLGWLDPGSYTALQFIFPESAGEAGTKAMFKIRGDFSAVGVTQSNPIDFAIQVHLGAVDAHERYFGSPGNTY